MAANTVPTVTDLRPCKRHIATHDANGKSVYADSPAQRYFPVPGVGSLARSWSIASVPAKLARDADMKAYLSEEGPTSYQKKDIVLPQPGANLLVVDLAPGGVSDLHQTVSIDFSICVIGEIDHELDGGETVRLLPGVSRHLFSVCWSLPRHVRPCLSSCRTGSYRSARHNAPVEKRVPDGAGTICRSHHPVRAIRHRRKAAGGDSYSDPAESKVVSE